MFHGIGSSAIIEGTSEPPNGRLSVSHCHTSPVKAKVWGRTSIMRSLPNHWPTNSWCGIWGYLGVEIDEIDEGRWAFLWRHCLTLIGLVRWWQPDLLTITKSIWDCDTTKSSPQAHQGREEGPPYQYIICTHADTQAHPHTHLYIYIYIHMCVNVIYIYIYVCVCACVCVLMIWVDIWIMGLCVWAWPCIYIYIYVCVCVSLRFGFLLTPWYCPCVFLCINSRELASSSLEGVTFTLQQHCALRFVLWEMINIMCLCSAYCVLPCAVPTKEEPREEHELKRWWWGRKVKKKKKKKNANVDTNHKMKNNDTKNTNNNYDNKESQ